MSEREIVQIVEEVLGLRSGALSADAALGVTQGWDSLAQLEILEKLEKVSGRMLSSEELLLAESLEDLIGLFESPVQ